MSAAKKDSAGGTQRTLKSDAKGVFVPMTPERLRQLDADRAKLKLSRGGAMAAIYDSIGVDMVGTVARLDERHEERSQKLAETVAPLDEGMGHLVDAVAALDSAWNARARQRQAIGTHSNQIAKLANVERLAVRDGGKVSDTAVNNLAFALQNVAQELNDQARREQEDDALRARVRGALESIRHLMRTGDLERWRYSSW